MSCFKNAFQRRSVATLLDKECRLRNIVKGNGLVVSMQNPIPHSLAILLFFVETAIEDPNNILWARGLIA